MACELRPVESSNIEAAGYDPETKELHVRFRKGGVWACADVPPEIADDFMESESKGGYFQKIIRRNHVGRKVETEIDPQAHEACK